MSGMAQGFVMLDRIIKHPVAAAASFEGILLAVAMAVGLLAGWSNGALGSAEMGIIGLGSIVLVELDGRAKKRRIGPYQRSTG